MKIKQIALGMLLALVSTGELHAQCSGQFPANTVCGNPGNAQALPQVSPRLSLAPPQGATQAISVTQSGPASGTTAGVVSNASGSNPALAYNQIFITGEAADVTGATTPKLTQGFNVAMLTGGANSTGAKMAQSVFLYKTTASAPVTLRDHIALSASGLIDAGDGGTGTALGQSKGTMFATGFGATARSGAINLFEVAGMEVDVGLLTGSSATYRFGINIVDNGNIQAVVQDAALSIGATGSSLGWNKGVLFSSLNGHTPVSNCLICTDGAATVTTGFDASSYIITGNFLNGPSSKFTVNGAGDRLTLNGFGVLLGNGTTTPYNNFLDPSGSGAIVIGGGGSVPDPTIYYRNTTHQFAGVGGVGVALTITPASGASGIKFNAYGAGVIISSAAGTLTSNTTLPAAQFPALTGDVTTAGGALATTIANNAVTLAKLATQATNTVLGNATAGNAVPTALSMPSCSTAGSALNWTTNTGFGCNATITAASMPTTGLTGTLQAAQEPAHTGDVTNTAGSLALTLATAQPAVHTWALAQTFTVAPVFTDQSGSRTALGLGTAATQNTGTSGGNVPLLNGANTWSSGQTMSAALTYGGVTLTNAVTGTGKMVLDTSPVLVTPALGTPASGVATNLTGLPLTTGVTGTLPVANGGTGDTGTAWTAYTPTMSSGSGTLTGTTITPSARYKTLGKTTFIEGTIILTNVGSGTPGGYVGVSLPASGPTSAASVGFVTSMTSAAIGSSGYIGSGANHIEFYRYDASSLWANGTTIYFSGVFEAS
jgi:hypothetical protein